jgi:hypothetical protein
MSQQGGIVTVYVNYIYSNTILSVKLDGQGVKYRAEDVSNNELYTTILYINAEGKNDTGYHSLGIESAGDLERYLLSGTASTSLFYSKINCAEGTWLPNNKPSSVCSPCPTGGFCPGGGRVWPLPGYWSYDEFSMPISCNMEEACPGAASVASQAMYNTDGSRITSRCADSYTGNACSQCSAGNYMLIHKCQTCGTTNTDVLSMGIVICVAMGLFIIISSQVVQMNPTSLSSFVGNIIIIQQFITLAQLALQVC